MGHKAPLPVSGTFAPGTGVLLLLFDHRLKYLALDERAWVVRANLEEWSGSSAAVLPTDDRTVRVTLDVDGPAGAGSWVSYTGNDVIARNDLPAAHFAAFPLTIV